ncbi:MAG: glycosyltransferase family 4 protein [bacterium]|nr:glycosyltransferase family 4 protein [bacterium]
MKVAIDVNFSRGGMAGIDVWTHGLIDGLSSVDVENEYLIFSFFIRDFKERIHSISIPKKDNFNLYIKRVPRPLIVFLEDHNISIIEHWLRKQNVDIFFGTSYFLPYLKKIKGVVTIHGLDFAEMDTYWYSDKWYKNVGIYLKRADYIVSVSEYVKKSIIQNYGIAKEKIKVVYPGIGKNFRAMTDNEKDKISAKIKVLRPFILSVATSVERKNLKRLMEVFAIVKTKQKDLKLVIAGNESIKEGLSREIEKYRLYDSVHFTGHLNSEELVYFYNTAELFIFPSLYEGFGLPVLEAMACGCPVITSNVSALPEISGGAAILVNPYNIEEIKEAVMRILMDNKLKDDMRIKGLKHAENFVWEKTAKEIVGIYKILKDN